MAADSSAVENMLLRLGRLAEDVPEVAELDLNPVLARPGRRPRRRRQTAPGGRRR
jgi:hypothetical protein